MSAISIHPYPRLDPKSVKWGSWILHHNNEPSSEFDLERNWDAYSKLEAAISVELLAPGGKLETWQLGAPTGSKPTLHVLVTCPETLVTFEEQVDFRQTSNKLRASVTANIDSSRVFGSLNLRAWVTLPTADVAGRPIPWLENRIVALANDKRIRLSLSEEVQEFPTKPVSFKENRWLNVPWRFIVNCADLETEFARDSFELVLNADNNDVLKMIKGENPKNLTNQLKAALARVQLQTVLTLSERTSEQDSVDAIAEKYPSSIAASAQRIAVQHLGLSSLAEALNLLRDDPATLEYRIMYRITGN